jgi:hypothetical protein
VRSVIFLLTTLQAVLPPPFCSSAEDAEASMAEWVGLGEWVQSMAYPHSLIERDVVRLLQLLQELDINQVDRLLDQSLALDPTAEKSMTMKIGSIPKL